MSIFIRLARGLTLLFWLCLLFNLYSPFAQPIAFALNLAGALLLLLHLSELMLFAQRLPMAGSPWRQRLLVLLFGVLQLLQTPRDVQAQEQSGAVAAD